MIRTDPLAELRDLAREIGRQARISADGSTASPHDPDWTITGYVVDRLYRQSRRAVALIADAHTKVTADAYRAGYDPDRFNPPRGAR